MRGCVRSGEPAHITVQIISNPSSVFAVRNGGARWLGPDQSPDVCSRGSVNAAAANASLQRQAAKEFHLCRLRRRLTFPKIARSIMTRNAPTQIGGQSGS